MTGGTVVFCGIFALCKTEASDKMQRGRNIILCLKNNKLVSVICFQKKIARSDT